MERTENADAKGRPATASYAAGDVVQVTDEAHDWYGALLVLTEATEGRRLMGFHEQPLVGQAYIFIQREQVERIGRTALRLARDGEAA